MKEQEKELLLKDLCARLPYHVRVKVWLEDGYTEEGPLDLQHNYGDVLLDAFYYNKITKIKPYLRPLCSMTKEEEMEFCTGVHDTVLRITEKNHTCILSIDQIDWFNAHHFDYRGLIEKGLALEAPEGMYNI